MIFINIHIEFIKKKNSFSSLTVERGIENPHAIVRFYPKAMFIIIIIIPLVSAIICIFLSNIRGHCFAKMLSSFFMLPTLLLSFYAFYHAGLGGSPLTIDGPL
jgi:hypothetical protein